MYDAFIHSVGGGFLVIATAVIAVLGSVFIVVGAIASAFGWLD